MRSLVGIWFSEFLTTFPIKVNDFGALRLGGVGVKWESRALKGGGELGGDSIQGGRRLFVTSVEVASTVGSVWRRSRSKGVCLPVLSGVSDSRRPVLGIPKW